MMVNLNYNIFETQNHLGNGPLGVVLIRLIDPGRPSLTVGGAILV